MLKIDLIGLSSIDMGDDGNTTTDKTFALSDIKAVYVKAVQNFVSY